MCVFKTHELTEVRLFVEFCALKYMEAGGIEQAEKFLMCSGELHVE